MRASSTRDGAAALRRIATAVTAHPAAAARERPATAPFRSASQTPPTTSGKVIAPRIRLSPAISRNASNPDRAPVCAPLTALKKSRVVPILRASARWGALKAVREKVNAANVRYFKPDDAVHLQDPAVSLHILGHDDLLAIII